VLSALSSVLLLGCVGRDTAPRPTFDLVFPPIVGELMTVSSPSVIDLNGDSVLDIVFGTGVDRFQPQRGRPVFTGEPDISGHVVAVSGATNEVLWRVPNPRDAFTIPRFTDLNGDSVPDVIMGGREGSLSAFSGVDGARMWRVAPAHVARTTFPYNFFTPGLIRDVNRDRVPDLVVVYGGDDTKLPSDPREPSYLAVISGADGAILAVHKTPDGNESYSSVVVYERPDGREWVIFGTGGETHGGAAYRAPVASLLDGSFATRAETLVAPGAKGVIAPATLVDLTGDADLDIVISTFDGRLVTVDGATGQRPWERRDEGEEAYHPAAVVRLSPDGRRLGLFVSRGVGIFPRYAASVHKLHDAADGRVLYQYRDPFYPAGAPLAVDLTGDGVDELFFFSVRFPTVQGARIHVLHVASGKLIRHEVTTNFWTTPVIVDARGSGTLEMIGLSWRQGDTPGTPTWRDVQWQLLRMDLGAKTPAFRSWAAYMGTTTDGHYHQW
jgi:outer membrane protein assembly factor BamB